MTLQIILPIAALIISVLTFLSGQYALRRAAGADEVKELRVRVLDLEKDLKRCQDENIDLMRKVLLHEDGGP